MLDLTAAAREIWNSAVAAVSSEQLVRNVFSCDGVRLRICDREFLLDDLDHIVVVGAGKAGAGMAAGVEAVLGDQLLDQKVSGWVNVPEDCVRSLRRIRLHGARPAGLNEPTVEGVGGTLKILQLVERMRERDLCVVLLSGGGSALLPAPLFGVRLADKQAVTRLISKGGATIQELNTVRKQLSLVKGGGLARCLKAGQMVSLIISDVIGDPLDIIASGPTVPDDSTPTSALEILERIVGIKNTPPAVIEVLQAKQARQMAGPQQPETSTPRVQNNVIGNNSVAVHAAAQRASLLGFEVEILGCGLGGIASDVGRDLARRCCELRARIAGTGRRVCLISGGEPTVKLSQSGPTGKGGRNQELVLAAIDELGGDEAHHIALLSGGTDGEDGPTDAAGAWLDEVVLSAMRKQQLQPKDFLSTNNSYEFFARAGGLLKTGPTHTNVMDVRVALVVGDRD